MNPQSLSVHDSRLRQNPFIEEFRDLFQYRDLVVQLVSRNIKTRYKRSVLGLLWTMINPLMMTAIIAFVFSGLFGSEKSGVIYILTGLVAWNFVQQVITHSMSELVWGNTLLNRIYIPKTVFAASALGTGLVNFFLSLIPIAILMLILRTPFRFSLLFLPVAIIILACFALGIGLLMSNFSAGFSDVYEMYQIFSASWFYLTPVLYPVDLIDPGKRWLFNLNPAYFIIEIFRRPIIDGVIPPMNILLPAIALAGFSLLLGWWLFTRNAHRLAYKI